MPQESPPPPKGTRTVSTSGRSSRISRAIGAVARHHRAVGDGMDEEAVEPGEAVLLDHLPPAVEGHLDDLAAQALDGRQLGGRRVVGHHDRGRHAELAGAPGHPLRHVAGARRVDPVAQALGTGEAHGVGGAAQLEGADGLQVLQLEPDLPRRVVHVQAHQRRAEGDSGQPLAGGPDLVEGGGGEGSHRLKAYINQAERRDQRWRIPEGMGGGRSPDSRLAKSIVLLKSFLCCHRSVIIEVLG